MTTAENKESGQTTKDEGVSAGRSGSAENQQEAGSFDQPWSVDVDTILNKLGVSPNQGLPPQKVESRLEQYGPNRLRQIEQRSTWEILVEQFKSLIVLILVAAAVVSFARQSWIDGGAIVVALIINTAVGFFTELRATRSIEALQEMDSVDAAVRRNGKKQRIPAKEVVPGDIILLNSGELVSADIRLTSLSKLQVDESALTGESVPVDKQVEPVEAETALAERRSMVFKGTAITRGQGEGVVIATGMETEIGEISELVGSAEDEETPLEKRLDQLGQKLVWVTLGVAVAVGVVGLVAGREIELMIETAIALAIAAVPEGLPIVATVALARGMWRMLERNALMRRLSSVETLGATSIICTDKTGTLTKGQMTVEQLNLSSGQVKVQLESQQIFKNDDTEVEPADDPTLETALRIALMCNDAELSGEAGSADDDRTANGDPLEVALMEAGRAAGLARTELVAQMPEVERDAFDRETKQMATVHETESGYFVAVKGAPASVLQSCSRLYNGNGGDPLDEPGREDWLRRNREMAENGLRVLALATKTMDTPEVDIYQDLQLVGLVGLIDPPRQGIQAAIDRCQQAGVRVIMVTGDQPETARAIAHSVGLVKDDTARVIHGAELGDNEFQEHREEILETDIFARVTPAQKLNLIDLHQDNGSIVGMTGDGVNDAPALKSADIGIAMGQRGTQVAREAADMILQDDAFPTIVAAIEQGRVIFENIRKFVIYLLSGNVGIILAVGLATFFGAPLPVLPLQILYLNMINDAFPALALGVGEDSRAVMERPPREAEEPIITRYHWGEIVGYGLLIGFNLLLTFYLAFTWLGLDETGAVTVTFLTLSISRLLHAFNMRSAASGLLDNEIVRNPYMWGAIGLSISLLLVAVYWPLLANVLQLTPLNGSGWLLVLGASVVPLIISQIYIIAFSRLTF